MKKENPNAIIAVVCNSATDFVKLKNGFSAREDLKGYRLLYCSDKSAANRHANYCDFAIVYKPRNDKSFTDASQAAYTQLEQRKIKIRLAFLNIINYIENK